MCRGCGVPLGDAEIVNNVFRIENVATQPAERITANDEERQRQGFELQTTFEWAVRDGAPDVRRASVADADGSLLILAYGAGATITRLNKGLRRRRNRTQFGFRIDPVSGYWAKNEDEDAAAQDPTAAPRQWIVPSVQDRKNALWLHLVSDHLPAVTVATLQHALLRGIEAVYQLEAGELLAEPLPNRDQRSGFLLYEATEGGAGVLTRLVSEPDAIADVARQALRIMHFDIAESGALPSAEGDLVDVAGTACVAACYRCLMSYYNQPDHLLLDRRSEGAREHLLRLAGATTGPIGGHSTGARQVDGSQVDGSQVDYSDSRIAQWRRAFGRLGLTMPDLEPLNVGELVVPLVWRSHYVCVSFEVDRESVVPVLEDKGFEVVIFGDESSWQASFRELATALGVH
jgi:hypothetical protein